MHKNGGSGKFSRNLHHQSDRAGVLLTWLFALAATFEGVLGHKSHVAEGPG
jgi:hypothetical protein